MRGRGEGQDEGEDEREKEEVNDLKYCTLMCFTGCYCIVLFSEV